LPSVYPSRLILSNIKALPPDYFAAIIAPEKEGDDVLAVF
jgi:hypothetical protein